jgi:hypothetical protein
MANLQLEVQAMKRSIIIAIASALLLSACSGSKEPAPEAKPAAVAKKTGKEEAHVNPWAKDTPADAPALAVKDEPAKKGGDTPKANPWAKDPPPGSEPVAEPAPVKKKKKKK